jgi:hypothetical protein
MARGDPSRIALTVFGLMIGTLQLARALTDRDLSDQLLARGVETALKLLNARHDCLAATHTPPGETVSAIAAARSAKQSLGDVTAAVTGDLPDSTSRASG